MRRHHIVRLLAAALVSITVLLPLAIAPAAAATERALYLYYTHTKETARIVFKRNGQYVQSGLTELNRFLRDWRRNEPAKMDPRLFDLVWEVYQEVGATQPINVVSAYRSPATNAMLRESSSGVAENSQHMRGTAMDFFIPGVPLSKLRAVAMRKQVGGVGYYPTSGSPFVHLDVGSVRAWPRMTKAQLQEIFPDGRTMHLPPDGKPLSQEGYKLALAEWKKCHAYPCGTGSSGTRVADAGSGRTLMDLFFGNNDKPTPGQPAPRAASAAAAPVQVATLAPQQATPRIAPVPATRPADLGDIDAPVAQAEVAPVIPFSRIGSAPLSPDEMTTPAIAPIPAVKSASLHTATNSALPSGDAVTALAALTAPMPQPRLIMSEQPETVTAYLPSAPQIRSDVETSAPGLRLPPLPALGGVTGSVGLRSAALPRQGGETGLTGLFKGTFGATRQNETIAAALASHIARQSDADAMRRPDFIAPDFEHVADIFTTPSAMTSAHFATIWDHDEADFDPTAEMGRYVPVMRVGDFPSGLPHGKFTATEPVALATN